MKKPLTSDQSKPFDIIVVGEINADLILSGNVIPEFNQVEKIVDRADLVMGSSAVIFACGASRLGLKTAMIGKVGNDDFGRFMLNSMRNRGVDVSSVCVDETVGTGLSVILARGNDRAILTYPGSIPDLKYHEIDFDLISRSRHLHLSGYYLLDELRPRVAELFQKVKAMGVSLSLDTNYDPKEVWNGGLSESLKYVDVFLPNETEAKAISGQTDLELALDWYAGAVGVTAVKMGEKGACVRQGDKPPVFQIAAAVEVIDTVGAGDSFDSGFIYGYLQDWPISEALKLGVACGTLSTLQAGGTSGQATLLEAKAFINEKLD